MPQRDQITKRVYEGTQTFKGTRLTTKKLFQIEQGMRSPSKSDLQKLKSFYNRHVYHTLKASGASSSQARRHRTVNVKELSSLVSRYDKAAKAIAQARKTTPIAVQLQMRKSDTVMPENLRARTIRSGLKEWREVMGDEEFEAMVSDFLQSDYLAELDNDEDEE